MTPGVYKVETVNGPRWRGFNGEKITDGRIDLWMLLELMTSEHSPYCHRAIHLYSHKSVSLALPMELL